MIKIRRPPKAPTVLVNKGAEKSRRDCEDYDRHKDAYRQGSKRFTFSDRVYGHMSVRQALLNAHHGKCCYCESRLGASSHAVIEHFRPKGSVKQESGQQIEYPGYYWLAYSWSNLLLSCDVCNSAHKRSLFPLADDKVRARCHHDDLNAECPLFVDPANEDPRQHISFRGPAIFGTSAKGRTTVEKLGLRRSALEEQRRERLSLLRHLQWIVKLVETGSIDKEAGRDQLDEAREKLEQAALPSAIYCAMAQDFLSA